MKRLAIGGPLHGEYVDVPYAPFDIECTLPQGETFGHTYKTRKVCLHNGEYERVLIYEGATE